MEADSQYADVMERALHNTVLGGMALMASISSRQTRWKCIQNR